MGSAVPRSARRNGGSCRRIQGQAEAAPLVVESYTPLENQPMHGQFSGRTQPTWLVLRNQP